MQVFLYSHPPLSLLPNRMTSKHLTYASAPPTPDPKSTKSRFGLSTSCLSSSSRMTWRFEGALHKNETFSYYQLKHLITKKKFYVFPDRFSDTGKLTVHSAQKHKAGQNASSTFCPAIQKKMNGAALHTAPPEVRRLPAACGYRAGWTSPAQNRRRRLFRRRRRRSRGRSAHWWLRRCT